MVHNEMNHVKNYKILWKFYIKINRDNVLYLIDCRKDSPIYEQVIEEYEELEKEVYKEIEPAAILKFGKIDSRIVVDFLEIGTPVIYVLTTIGDKISKLSSQYFNAGDYLSGMLIDAMGDDYLIQIEKEIHKIIKEECAIRSVGISGRLEAPQDIPMTAQKVILDETKALEKLNIDVTAGYMYTTVKTTAHILVLTEDESVFKIQHDCSKCQILDCKLRTVPAVDIKIVNKSENYTIQCKENESILESITRQEKYFSAVCGGTGRCGKCKVQVIEGNLEATSFDRSKFTENQLEGGWRLACKAYPKEPCTIRFHTEDESDFAVISNCEVDKHKGDHRKEEGYVIGIDIGTTTIAVNLVGITTKTVIKTFTTINKQRSFGADVISRIQASNDGKKEVLKQSIRKDLLQGIKIVVKEAKVDQSLIRKVAIAGNTTMGHLLMGYSCETLGVFPFTPVNIQMIEESFYEILEEDDLDIPVVLLPGISTYVGGDIVSGLFMCDFDKVKEPCMLIDLGTNGEIAIGNKDRILVSSTAAGPAFEGGNISHGVGSIQGAICGLAIDKDKINYQTIGGRPPVGICGTGVIEITSELLKSELMDETGLLDEGYFENGYEIVKDEQKSGIVFTQKDIREIQLAKSAVRAGIETLIRLYGIPYNEIKTVYLAGGFGYKVNIEKAIHIGLLPKEFFGKIKAIGNSSLGGAVKYLLDENGKERINRIVEVSEEVNSSYNKDFNKFYMENMTFEQ